MKNRIGKEHILVAPKNIPDQPMYTNHDFRESYEFNRTLIQSAPYPILVTGLDTSIYYVNPAFEKLTGFHSDELIGKKSPYPWWPPEKLREYGKANALGRKKELNKLERYYRKKNSERFWVVLHIAPVRYKGVTRYYVANWVDFTERKQAEEALQESEARFRMLSENSLSGIFIFRVGRLSYVNPALAAIMDRSRDELTSQDPFFFVHPEDSNLLKDATRKRLKGEDTHLQYTFRCIRGDGKTIWLEVLSTRFEDKGHPALLGTVLDVTEQKQAEQEADHLRQIMAHVSRVNTLGELATSLAHELNQPLAAITTNAGTALRMIHNGKANLEEIIEILEDITADGQRAGDIIRRMREPLKRRELRQEFLDFNRLIIDIYSLVRNEAMQAGVTVDLRLTSGLPAIKADRTQLQQVLLNLLVNALDSVKDPAVSHRWIEVRSSPGDDHSLRVEISDSGRGISRADREHLFEPFYSTKTDGLGVGLSICKNILEVYGGHIWQENRSEGGAKFIFTLPTK